MRVLTSQSFVSKFFTIDAPTSGSIALDDPYQLRNQSCSGGVLSLASQNEHFVHDFDRISNPTILRVFGPIAVPTPDIELYCLPLPLFCQHMSYCTERLAFPSLTESLKN